MKYLKKFESINKEYLLDLIDIGFKIHSDSDDRLSLKREKTYNNNFTDNTRDIGTKYVDISHFLTIKTCYEGRWCITLYNLKIDSTYDSYYLNNALIREHYILPDFVLNLLNISIDTAIKVMYAKNIESIPEFIISCIPYGYGNSFRVVEVVQFIFK